MSNVGRRLRVRSGTPPARERFSSLWLLRTAVVIGVSLGVFAALVFALFRADPDRTEILGAASLTWDADRHDALGEGKRASVEIIDDDGTYQVFVFEIDVLRSVADSEVIEVWLVRTSDDDVIDRRAIGRIDGVRARLFQVDDGVLPQDFDRVEFSLEPRDDDAIHSGRTLIGGDIVWLVDPP